MDSNEPIPITSDDLKPVDDCNTEISNVEIQFDVPTPTYSDDVNSLLLNEQVLNEEFSAIPFGDEMTSDECSKAFTIEEVHVNEPIPMTSSDLMPVDDCNTELSNEELQVDELLSRVRCFSTYVDTFRKFDDSR